MSVLTRDPLLAAAKVLLALLMGLLAIAGAGLVLGAILAPVFEAEILAQIAAEAGQSPPRGFVWGLAALLLAIAALVAMIVYFLLMLWRIVGTVAAGDPFVPENARRLSLMGWLALAGNILAVVIGAGAVWLARVAEVLDDDFELGEEFGFDASGLILILTLFILARVFRKGTQMRDELEGTV